MLNGVTNPLNNRTSKAKIQSELTSLPLVEGYPPENGIIKGCPFKFGSLLILKCVTSFMNAPQLQKSINTRYSDPLLRFKD